MIFSIQFNANNEKDDEDIDNPKIIDVNDQGEVVSGNENGSDSIMNVTMPQVKSNTTTTPTTSQQIIWIPAGVQQSTMFNIKQLNYSQVINIYKKE